MVGKLLQNHLTTRSTRSSLLVDQLGHRDPLRAMARPILILILIWHAIATRGQRIEVISQNTPFKDGQIEILSEDSTKDVEDPLAVLLGLEPASVLSESALYNRRKFFNISELEKKLEFPRNYGLSTVLSSDVLGLKRAIENMPDSKCKNQSLQLVRGMLTGKEWALKSEFFFIFSYKHRFF